MSSSNLTGAASLSWHLNADKYYSSDGAPVYFNNRRKIKKPPHLAGSLKIFGIGQSLISNYNDNPSTLIADPNVYNFNPLDGNFYEAKDPMLGCTGTGGSHWIAFGNEAIRRGYSSFVFCTAGQGGTDSSQWADYNQQGQNIKSGIFRMQLAGFPPDFVIWQQGIADAIEGRSTDYYLDAIVGNHVFAGITGGVFQHVRDMTSAPILVCVESYYNGGPQPGSAAISTAQTSVINTSTPWSIWPGPNDDTKEKFDGTHLAQTPGGVEAWATEALDCIQAVSVLEE